MKIKSNNKFLVISIAIVLLLCGLPSLLLTLYLFGSASGSGNYTFFYVFISLGFASLVLSLILWGFWFGTYIAKKNDVPVPETTKDPLEITDKRIKNIVDRPEISFHFVDKNVIETNYNNYFREPIYESFSTESESNRTKELSIKIPYGSEGKVGGQTSNKRIDNLKVPDLSLEAKFMRYQREIVARKLVNINLELVEVEVDSSDLQVFNQKLLEFKSVFGLKLDNIDEIKMTGDLLSQAAVQKTLDRLERVNGLVLISGKFKISLLDNEHYRFTYTHPVNDYLPKEANKVTITFNVNKNHIEPSISGYYAQDIGESILINVYGKTHSPLDRSNNKWELRIIPLAIYQ